MKLVWDILLSLIVMPATAASIEPPLRLGIIPSNGIVFSLMLRFSALAMALIMSMSKPSSFPSFSSSNGGQVAYVATTIRLLSALSAEVDAGLAATKTKREKNEGAQ